MSLLVKRLLDSKTIPFGSIHVAGSKVSLSRDKESLKGFLNSSLIFDISPDDCCIPHVAQVVSDLIDVLAQGNTKVSVDKSEWDVKESFEKKLYEALFEKRPGIKIEKIKTASSPATMIVEHKSIPQLRSDLRVFTKKLANISIIVQDVLKCASIMCGKRLNSSTWGVKDIQKHLSKYANHIQAYNSEIEKLDFYSELIDKSVSRLDLKLASASNEDRKIVSQVLIPDIKRSYDGIKSLVGNLVFDVAPMVYVDELFKKHTNFPVTWFVSGEVLSDLKDGYQFMVGFLVDVPQIENRVLLPLDS